jgi:hypothetical protein
MPVRPAFVPSPAASGLCIRHCRNHPLPCINIDCWYFQFAYPVPTRRKANKLVKCYFPAYCHFKCLAIHLPHAFLERWLIIVVKKHQLRKCLALPQAFCPVEIVAAKNGFALRHSRGPVSAGRTTFAASALFGCALLRLFIADREQAHRVRSV